MGIVSAQHLVKGKEVRDRRKDLERCLSLETNFKKLPGLCASRRGLDTMMGSVSLTALG
jgi:hypothetical protein